MMCRWSVSIMITMLNSYKYGIVKNVGMCNENISKNYDSSYAGRLPNMLRHRTLQLVAWGR